MGNGKSIPIREGLWGVNDAGEIALIGSKCTSCGELFFPRKQNGVCTHCQGRNLEDVRLSDQGKVITCTVVYQRPGGGFYKGSVPYAYGVVELPEGVRFMSLLVSDDLESIKVGSNVRLVIDPLFEDEEGNQVLTYKFKVVK